ncbi:MAG: hypothetical protein HY043_09845 [Verrucomicrobia bacterium]|nr:hypothetical protein [Verrucomicrobiota bacterium]
MSNGTEERKLAAIMFTDIVGYTALSQRNEALALELLEEHRRLLRPIFPRHQGTEIKTMGDGFLVQFNSALAAARCAIEIQKVLFSRNASEPTEPKIQIRIGIHVGDVIQREGDVLGDGVNIASRLQPLAEPGGICISVDVARQIRHNLEASVVTVGHAELKNVQLPLEVFRIVLPWEEAKAEGKGQKEKITAEVGRGVPPSRAGGLKLAAAVAVVLLAIGIGWWLVHQSGSATKQVASSPSASPLPAAVAPVVADQKSIAVLPFVNMSADKADEYLSDGMTEELLNVLTKVKGLRVPGRSSSFAFKGKNEEGIFRKVGEQLHVSAVLEGSVRKAGNQLRITAQLINVADGFHLWSETYDRDMTNIFAIQSDIAERVALALKVQLGVEETRALAKKPTENTEAYRLYLLGRYHFAKFTQEGWTNAMHSYNQALKLDPGYALAYCGLADTYGWMGGFVMQGKSAWAEEKRLAQKALALDPDLADAHLSLFIALAAAFDWQGGENEIKRALELNPNLAFAHDQYAWLLTVYGRFDEAIANGQKAVELDSLSPLMNVDLGWQLQQARRYGESIAQLRKTLELDSNNANVHHWLAWSLLLKGESVSAIADFQKAKVLDDLPWYEGSLGYAYAISGNRTKAEQILRDVEDLARRRYVAPGVRMAVYLGLGEKDRALDWLEKCYDEQDTYCWYLKVDPLYDSVRKEPRFQALLKKVGLDK